VFDSAQFLRQLSAVVERCWGLGVLTSENLDGGMNSVAVMLETSAGRVVAKWVPEPARDDLIRGAEVARTMSDRGIHAGRPIPTRDGMLSAPVLDGELALLAEVPGTPLTSDEADQWDWGVTLARIHAIGRSGADDTFFPWLEENGTDPEREPWVKQAVLDVLREYERLPLLTWAQLHTDPAPEAFRRDTDGDIGVIDWAGSVRGPVLYDIASAVMYAGGRRAAGRMLEGYLSIGVLPENELRTHLATFQRYRAAVQAVYFSKRVHEADLTGIESQDDNAQGLRDAQWMLRDLRVTDIG
jgi:Ser/Thr protein kinase RdoA (MazF antagonist)